MHVRVLQVFRGYSRHFPGLFSANQFDFLKLVPEVDDLLRLAPEVQIEICLLLQQNTADCRWTKLKSGEGSPFIALCTLLVRTPHENVRSSVTQLLVHMFEDMNLFPLGSLELKIWLQHLWDNTAVVSFLDTSLGTVARTPSKWIDMVVTVMKDTRCSNDTTTTRVTDTDRNKMAFSPLVIAACVTCTAGLGSPEQQVVGTYLGSVLADLLWLHDSPSCLSEAILQHISCGENDLPVLDVIRRHAGSWRAQRVGVAVLSIVTEEPTTSTENYQKIDHVVSSFLQRSAPEGAPDNTLGATASESLQKKKKKKHATTDAVFDRNKAAGRLVACLAGLSGTAQVDAILPRLVIYCERLDPGVYTPLVRFLRMMYLPDLGARSGSIFTLPVVQALLFNPDTLTTDTQRALTALLRALPFQVLLRNCVTPDLLVVPLVQELLTAAAAICIVSNRGGSGVPVRSLFPIEGVCRNILTAVSILLTGGGSGEHLPQKGAATFEGGDVSSRSTSVSIAFCFELLHVFLNPDAGLSLSEILSGILSHPVIQSHFIAGCTVGVAYNISHTLVQCVIRLLVTFVPKLRHISCTVINYLEKMSSYILQCTTSISLPGATQAMVLLSTVTDAVLVLQHCYSADTLTELMVGLYRIPPALHVMSRGGGLVVTPLFDLVVGLIRVHGTLRVSRLRGTRLLVKAL